MNGRRGLGQCYGLEGSRNGEQEDDSRGHYWGVFTVIRGDLQDWGYAPRHKTGPILSLTLGGSNVCRAELVAQREPPLVTHTQAFQNHLLRMMGGDFAMYQEHVCLSYPQHNFSGEFLFTTEPLGLCYRMLVR